MQMTATRDMAVVPSAKKNEYGNKEIVMNDFNVGNERNEETLSGEERQRFESLEKQIQEFQAAALVVGRALRDSRDARLYRETHRTFEAYVEDRFDMTRGHAYNLMAAVGAAETLAAKGIEVANEFQVRPLIKLDADQRAEAWQMAAAAANGNRVTHRHVKAAVDELTGKRPPMQFAAPKAALGDSASSSESEDVYWSGALTEHLGKIDGESVDLLFVGELGRSDPQKAAAEFSELLEEAAPSLRPNHQVLLFCRAPDYRPFVAAAEERGYEFGVPLVLDLGKSREAADFSFRNEMQFVLHFRRGDAALFNSIGNVFDANGDDGIPGLAVPLALVEELIQSAVPTGAVVLDPTQSAAATVAVCRRLGIHGIGVQPCAELFNEGREWLKSA
jgi:hypothetical protein